MERSNPAHRIDGRPSTQLFPRMATLGPVESHTLSSGSRWSAASREVTGQGLEAMGAYVPDCLGHLPSRSLAAGALPQPDRLGHLLSQTRGAAGWRVLLRRGIVSDAPLTSLPGAVRFSERAPVGCRSACGLSTSLRAASHASPRRAAQSAAPKVPSIVGWPRSGSSPILHNLSPACGLRASAFSIFARPQPLTRP